MAVQSGGASGGDPTMSFVVSGVTGVSMGLDNSDGDKFKIRNGAGFDNTEWITIDPATNNIGIGTSSPESEFVIQSDASGAVGPVFELRNNGSAASTAAEIGFRNDGGAGDYNAKIKFTRTASVGAPTDISFFTKTGGVLGEVVTLDFLHNKVVRREEMGIMSL